MQMNVQDYLDIITFLDRNDPIISVDDEVNRSPPSTFGRNYPRSRPRKLADKPLVVIYARRIGRFRLFKGTLLHSLANIRLKIHNKGYLAISQDAIGKIPLPSGESVRLGYFRGRRNKVRASDYDLILTS